MAKINNATVTPRRRPPWGSPPKRPRIDDTVLLNVQSKIKFAAFIFFRCHPMKIPHRTVKWLKSLQKYFRIELVGPCGELKCYSLDQCLRKIERDFKFLIHIEDFVDRDYVSSETYRILQYNVVPIIFGRNNLARYLPQGGFVSASKFTSPEQLGRHLEMLDGDPVEYINHFWWRYYFNVETHPDLCPLCKTLRSFRHSNQSRTYADINRWLTG